MIQEIRDYLSKIGTKGGRISGAKKTKEHFIRMGKLSAQKRNKKRLEQARSKIEIKEENEKDEQVHY